MNHAPVKPTAPADASAGLVPDQAYVTLLTSDSYLAPVLVLDHSLKRHGARRKLIVLVSPNLAPATTDCLAQMQILTRPIEFITNPAAEEHIKNVWRRLKGTMKKVRLYATVYTKLRIWELAEYKKLVFLDSDMMVLANPDELFDRPNWSAVNTGGELSQHRDWIGLNSGLLVIEPSAAVFADMMAKAPRLKSFDWGDQGFIHAYFPQWPERPELHLPHTFNMPVEFIDQYVTELGYGLHAGRQPDLKTVKIIHYWREHRPWQVPLRKMDLAMAQKQPVYFESFQLWLQGYAEVCARFPDAARQTISIQS